MLPRAALACALLATTPAWANDSVAELGTGGLVLSRTDAIAMTSENLFISADEVRVDYVFRNQSDADVEAIVAFPMPDIEGSPYEMPALPPNAGDNFLDFRIRVDGSEIRPALEQRAFAASLDVTGDLKEHGVPPYPFGDAAFAALAALPRTVADDWVTRGLMIVDRYDDGSGWKDVRTPFWALRSTYWWRSRFPAGRDVAVSHRYRPSVGGTAGLSFFWDGKFQDGLADYRRRFCIDRDFEQAIARAARKSPDGNPEYTETRLRYVLSSGGNWALGQIGRFHLTVDKGDTFNLVSFCPPGKLTKTGPTTFEVSAEDFYPQRDLEILILLPYEHERGAPLPPRKKRAAPPPKRAAP